jgi:NTE family protein
MAFGAALRQELRSLALAQHFLADLPASAVGALARLRDARLHVIGAEEEFRGLKVGSHRDASWRFLQDMRDLGRSAADRWLEADLASVGVRSTMDLSGFAGSVLDPIVAAAPLAVS